MIPRFLIFSSFSFLNQLVREDSKLTFNLNQLVREDSKLQLVREDSKLTFNLNQLVCEDSKLTFKFQPSNFNLQFQPSNCFVKTRGMGAGITKHFLHYYFILRMGGIEGESEGLMLKTCKSKKDMQMNNAGRICMSAVCVVATCFRK